MPAHPFKRAAATGKTIAIVGAGPAGLSCAHRLAMLGHDVVIFEKEGKAGGLNEYGIAKYKLTDDFAQKEIDFLLGIGGIEIRCRQVLGENLQLRELHAQYDAVFLGLGLGASRKLGLTGEDAPGLLAAVDYIAALRQADDLAALPVPKRAIVIGAGNTAIDMAVQIQRLGAEEVTLVYRRGFDAMTATHHEQEIAKANQVRMLTWAQPQQVLLDAAARWPACASRKRACRARVWRAPAKRSTWRPTPSSRPSARASTREVLHDPMASLLRREGDKIAVDAGFRTVLPGIYAGGDCVAPGQDLTVQAVQHGKLAALAIHSDFFNKVEAA